MSLESPARILIVEDEIDLARALEYSLQKEGYRITVRHHGQSAMDIVFGNTPPDLVLLDLLLPDRSGTEICRAIKSDERTKAIPVVMVTAKGEEIDRLVGFEMGADDYITKPFSVRELALRVRAILRRTRSESKVERRVIEVGPVILDESSHQVWIEGDEVLLTALEFRLLHTFMERIGRVQTRDQLLNDVWGYSCDVSSRTVDTHVKRLREKMGVAARMIETRRGVGYCLRDPSVGGA